MDFELLPLPYPKDALEPYISAKTLELHYEKHHRGYLSKLQNIIVGTGMSTLASLTELIKDSAEDYLKRPVYNNAAQVWNHTFYWNSMKKYGGGRPSDMVMSKIERSCSFEKFIKNFKDEALNHFGSGWIWMTLDKRDGELKIFSTSNATNMVTSNYLVPLLVLDIWEHAYYLDYQNNRAAYIDNFVDHLLNWDFVEQNIKAIEDKGRKK